MNKKGFALIYTIIIATFILLIAGIILSVSLTESDISSHQTESVKAFYAADAGIECVRHYHTRGVSMFVDSTNSPFDCGAGKIDMSDVEDCRINSRPAEVSFDLNFDNGSCANVTAKVSDISTKTVTDEETETQQTSYSCSLTVLSVGKDNCDNPTVERTVQTGI